MEQNTIQVISNRRRLHTNRSKLCYFWTLIGIVETKCLHTHGYSELCFLHLISLLCHEYTPDYENQLSCMLQCFHRFYCAERFESRAYVISLSCILERRRVKLWLLCLRWQLKRSRKCLKHRRCLLCQHLWQCSMGSYSFLKTLICIQLTYLQNHNITAGLYKMK